MINKKLWIFDLDGTILDTLSTIANSCNHIIEKYGIEKIDVEDYKYFLGNGADFLMRSVFEYRKIPEEKFDEIFGRYISYYNENPVGDTKAFEGIEEFILQLKEKQIYRAVLSNKPDEAAIKVVNKIFPKESFDIVIGDREDLKRKPNPEAIYKILRDLDLKAEDAVIVGDTEVDIRTGKNAGIETIAVCWGFRTREELIKENPDHICNSISELNNL